MSHHPHLPGHRRAGGWLPRDHSTIHAWVATKIAEVERTRKHGTPLHPVIAEFKDLIESDPMIHKGFHDMFAQIPHKRPYCDDPTGKPQVRDYKLMLELFNVILTTAPEYQNNDLVGFPFNAILDWPMGTKAGSAMFTNQKVNAQFKKIFDVWTEFLSSPDSCYVLNTDGNGWFGPQASEVFPDFNETYVCDPSAPYRGFKSWDDFFTRHFRPGVREIAFPTDDRIVNSGCESTVYRIATEVKEKDQFWLKGQPYSLADMLNGDDLMPQFVGGTVMQAFLSATMYHRWHSPINGTIAKIVAVPGTYFAENPMEGFDDPDGVPDPAAPDLSQAYITAVATRMLMFIQADNPSIGMMCMMTVGMSEVSSCETTVQVGQKVKKGDELGMFHFGGSTHCLIFRPETKVTFDPSVEVKAHLELNSAIATIG